MHPLRDSYRAHMRCLFIYMCVPVVCSLSLLSLSLSLSPDFLLSREVAYPLSHTHMQTMSLPRTCTQTHTHTRTHTHTHTHKRTQMHAHTHTHTHTNTNTHRWMRAKQCGITLRTCCRPQQPQNQKRRHDSYRPGVLHSVAVCCNVMQVLAVR